MSLKDFDLLRVIGRGSYAKVVQVEMKATRQIYAMKIIKKEMINDEDVRLISLGLFTSEWIAPTHHPLPPEVDRGESFSPEPIK